MIYLDSAATTLQKPESVHRAVAEAMATCASLGRSGHTAARRASEVALACREAAGRLFETPPEQVVFTFNATHGLNIAIKSLVSPGDKVVISGFEHNAVVRPLHALGARITVAGRKLFDPADTLSAFDRAITPDTKAVITTHVSNVFGYILPVAGIAAICRTRGVPLIVDASQSAGALPVSLQAWDAAFIAMPGHKGLHDYRARGFCCAGGRRSLSWRAAPAAFPSCRRCRTSCRTWPRPAPTTYRALQGCWPASATFKRWGFQG